MRSFYSRIAWVDLDRLAALSLGVFAVAMAVRVTDLRAPAAPCVSNAASCGPIA